MTKTPPQPVDTAAASGVSSAVGQPVPDDPSPSPSPEPPEVLHFPDVPRLELDELLEQLRDRADDVLSTQGRLRGLLRANATVASDLSLNVVLRRIVAEARELLGARYAALGVIGSDGELEQFLHAGMEDDVVAEIGDLPRGRGILGLLINRAVPIRLPDLAADGASAGFPPGHPPMASFLGVPIRVAGDVFGNLYLTERLTGGEFTAEDEELAKALAATAGVAIANARLFTESEQRRGWLAAAGELTHQLLSADAADPLELITRIAATAADADFATLAVRHDDHQLVVKAATGSQGVGLLGRTGPLAASPTGEVILTGKPLLVPDSRAGDQSLSFGRDVGQLVVVPVASGEVIRGALTLGRLADRTPFTEGDMSMAASFGNHAAVAMELIEARADQLELASLEDHDRIARDLHDHVIQEVFAVGMGLQGLATVVDKPAVGARIIGYVDALDRVVSQIRTTIFQLHVGRPHGSLQARLLAIVGEHTSQLGFAPQVRFTGPLDTLVPQEVADDVLAVTRESLSNAARHAGAGSVEILLSLDQDLVRLEVTDDGRGLGTPTRTSGLANIRRRAEDNHGTLELTTPDDGGTRIVWTARIA